jgi:TPR repeat protein
MLGAMYARGNGIPKDLVAAYQWYDLAAKHGWGSAEELRDDLAKLMTRAQLSEAQTQTSQNGPNRSLTPE